MKTQGRKWRGGYFAGFNGRVHWGHGQYGYSSGRVGYRKRTK
jgi:hypothetical protein